ncbi:MAG: DUF4886 domain-containing protein [Ruminococcaceae bacterium]|nr:DUF4886 domain-containing protein [Oscillospiraceae bacterium]
MKRILSLLLLVALLITTILPGVQTAYAEEAVPVRPTKAASWDNDGDGTLSILCIGNSFSVDMMQYVYNIAKNLGISKIHLGNLYIGGCTLNKHYTNAKNDSAAYTYYTNTSGSWTTTSSYKMSKALTSRSWDFVTMQQASGDSGTASTYNSDLTNLISYVKGKLNSSSTKLVWHMTWAYQGGSSKLSNSVYSSQTDMYDKIIAAVKSKIVSNSNFKMIIPNGTAIQNARTSLIKDNLTRDGYHLNYNFGRYIAGLTVVKTLTGLDISKVTYKPGNVNYALQQIAIESANNAVASPYAKTTSAHSNVATSKLYARLYPKLTAGGYWNSANTTYNKIITTASNSPYFHCTEQFTKDTLPMGSVIKVSSGYEYRPDGWLTDAKQDSANRPGITSKSYAVALNEWWGDWTIRAFNICSTTDNKDISKMTAEQIHAIFQIYVPIEDLNTKYYQLRLNITPLAYWHSSNSTHYNKLITSSDINQRYFATQQIPKANIPNGSVIKVSSSWQHRPEGWVSNAVQDSSTRPAVRTDRSILVNSTWHGKFTTRAFNVSKQDNSSLEGVALSTLQSAFKIYIPASSHSHTYSTTVTKAATCTETGIKTHACTVCVYSYTETIPMVAHTEVTVPAVLPTCTAVGLSEGKKCSVCNAVLVAQTESPALGHNEVIDDAIDATCTEPGLTEGKHCSICNAVIVAQEEVAALGHRYDSVVTDPNCTDSGYTTYTCSVCNDTLVDNQVDALGHTEAIDEAVAPTCTETGLTEGKHCSVCNEVLLAQEEVAALGHSYNTVVTAPDCTNGGFTTYTCSVCFDSYIADETEALGHTEAIDEAVEPTCTETGLTEGKHCSVCNEVLLAQEVIPAADHSYDEGKITTEPLCGSNGVKTYTCVNCGHEKNESIEGTIHTAEYVAMVAPTCTEDGLEAHYKCIYCKKTFIDETCIYPLPVEHMVISATGHDYDKNVTAPTCEDNGYTTYVCFFCKDTYTADETEAIGHSYTYTDNGEKHTVGCSNCDYSVIEAHTYEDGKCICGAIEVVAPKEMYVESLKPSMSIVVGAEMSVAFTVQNAMVSNYESFYLVVEKEMIGGESKTVIFGYGEDQTALTPMPNAANPFLHNASFTGLTAKEMGDQIRATLYCVDADGTLYYGPTQTDSIKSYLMRGLDLATSTPEKKTMYVDMLRYGAVAQIYFGYDTDNLVTDDLTEEHLNSATTVIPEAVDGSKAEGGLGTLNTSVVLKARVTLTLSHLKPGANLANMKFVVKDALDGTVIKELPAYNLNPVMVAADFDDVGAKQMRRLITVTLYDGDTAITDTVTWSVESYVAKTRATSTDAGQIDLVNAMLTYGDAVAAYMATQ